MDDIEKTRAEYVQRLETTLQHLRVEHDKYKALAEKWEPRFTIELGETAKIGLEFGGKRAHVQVELQALSRSDTSGVAASVSESLTEALVTTTLAKLLQPSLEVAKRSATVALGAGKW